MGKNSKDIVFVAALRTAIGKFNGALKGFQAHDLGKDVITNILKMLSIFLIVRTGSKIYHLSFGLYLRSLFY